VVDILIIEIDGFKFNPFNMEGQIKIDFGHIYFEARVRKDRSDIGFCLETPLIWKGPEC